MTVTINGTTGIDQIQSGVVQQSDLAVNVAGNGPCFSAYQSVGQSLATATLTKLQFQSKEFDPTNAFDNVTNFRFQPNVAGYYQMTGAWYSSAPAGQQSIVLYKNGSAWKYFNQFPNGSTNTVVAGSCLVYLNGSTDYAELIAAQTSGVAINTTANASTTYFQGYLARSA